ncbi:hypothetical protein [Sulfurimonas sp.]|uniref:hypothetical protein n=1 Tax=Sulfurimonas sp. TaxID=2022749 RepID=UPI003D13F6C5
MASKKEYGEMIVEHLLEIRYSPSGSFLDQRGFVADYIRNEGILPHWQIDTNTIHFRDQSEKIDKEGAFAGFKNAGYIVYDPDTKNYFQDKSIKFWKTLSKNGHYDIPEILRIGTRTKVFLPSEKDFQYLNDLIKEKVFSNNISKLMGNSIEDTQFIFVLKESDFELRIVGGPIHKNEVQQYIGFEHPQFEKTGIFLDIDISKVGKIEQKDMVNLIKKSMEMTWNKIDQITAELGV